MNILEEERDWFRSEAIRLDKCCKGNIDFKEII